MADGAIVQGKVVLFGFVHHHMGLWVPHLSPCRAVEILEAVTQPSQCILSTYCMPSTVVGIEDPATKMEI